MTTKRTRTGIDDDGRRLAVLIDADNAQPAVIEALLAEIARFGTASVKRIYGNWTSPQLAQWKNSLLKHSIQPVQQFAYTSGKNATDSSLIIDAMDLLYTRRFDGFCLVSSDSDFTRLAQRLREEGLVVYGFGERKTPAPFVAACDKFIYTEVLRPDAADAERLAAAAAPRPATKKTVNAAKRIVVERAPDAVAAPGPAALTVSLALELLRQAIAEEADDSGWAFLGNVGNYVNKVRPDFDSRLFGHSKLSELLRANPQGFELEERGDPKSSSKVLFVRTRTKPR